MRASLLSFEATFDHLFNGKREILDYSNARIRVRELAINYYGAAGGGPWVGYHGIPTALTSLAAVGNIIALCSWEGAITDASFSKAMKALESIYNDIGRQADPF